jgi:hypothetical protein
VLAEVDGALALGFQQVPCQRNGSRSRWRAVAPALDSGAQIEQTRLPALQARPSLLRFERARHLATAIFLWFGTCVSHGLSLFPFPRPVSGRTGNGSASAISR